MKKFLSLLLAAMMLLSCATAMAQSGEQTTTKTGPANISMLTATGPVHFDVDDNNYSAEQQTDLWLQVDASGQIDVTVPLVLLFHTNVDGGEATCPGTSYQIMNNNNTNLVLTKVAVTDNSETTDNPMKLVEEKADLNDNEYYVVLTPDLTTDESPTITKLDLAKAVVAEQNGEVAAKVTDYDIPSNQGGLFQLNKVNTGDTTDTATPMKVVMKTGQLNFVTKRSDDDAAMNKNQGVHLLSVSYTVAINTKSQYGKDIAGSSEGTTYENDNQVDMSQSYSTNDAGTINVTEAKKNTNSGNN